VAYGTPQSQAVPTPTAQPQLPRKHSGLGIISFILFLVTLALLVIMGLLYSGTKVKTGTYHEMLGGVGYTSALSCLLGVIFGIAGVVKKNRKRIFAILGLIFNLIIGIFMVFITLSS
jgi:hypothetical protein